jgi:hypothetical protein
MRGPAWASRIRVVAVGLLCGWALTNVLLVDYAVNQIHPLIRAVHQQERGTGAPPESTEPAPLVPAAISQRKLSIDTLERRIGLFQFLVVLIGIPTAIGLLTWQTGAASRLARLAPDVRYGPGKIVPAWLIPGVNLIAPVQSLSELLTKTESGSTRPFWRRIVLVGWWSACLFYAGLAVALAVASIASTTQRGRILRDEILIAAGLVGLAIAILSAVLVIWIDARLSDKSIEEPESPWARWGAGPVERDHVAGP